jgi:hypothetical protein
MFRLSLSSQVPQLVYLQLKIMRLSRKAQMDTLHLNTYLHLIESLLQCAKGEEWLLLQQHEELIDAEFLTVMAQVTEQLNTEGNLPAAKFLHDWTEQLTHLLRQNTHTETSAENRAQSYLKLIQTILGCVKGDEVAILSQHPDLVDQGLVYTMNQVAAQLAAKGSQDTAIYLKHLAAEVNRVLLHPSEERTQISSPQTNNHVKNSASQEVEIASNLAQEERRSAVKEAMPTVVAAPPSKSSSPNNNHVNGSIDPEIAAVNQRQPDLATSSQLNSHIEELLENISIRLEQIETSINKHQNPVNPLWYMSILEQADAQGWIISSEEVEQLIGTKPHCAPDRNSFVRGCWKFEKAGKVGMHSSWRVTKEIVTPSIVDVSLPLGIASVAAKDAPKQNLTPESESTKLEFDLSSPWAENS